MNQNRMLRILLSPHVSEKSVTALEDGNRYAFRVVVDATKREIRKAVESIFDVKVESVQVINVKGKVKRFGARTGKRSDWRKAYVRLQAGQEIEIAGGE